MKILANVTYLIKSLLIGCIIGFAVLFFIPNSPMDFNWHEAKTAWDFYKNTNQSNHSDKLAGSHQFSYSAAIEKAGPSVVSVRTIRQGRARPATDGRKGDMLVDVSVGVGSGVIFSEDGYIVTNHHVIARSIRVEIHFPDGRKEYAKLVGVDPQNDIAVLKVNIKTPRVAELGTSANVKTGDIIMAIGTPFGLFQNSVTLGIVSAIDHGPFYPKIQTDATINYGNSGGALINSKGQVIGISRSKFSVSRNDETGISFGVPIDIVKEVFDDIKKHGRVIRNWLGINVGQLNQAGHQHLNPGVDFGVGLIVRDIEIGSPSAEAGLKVNDLLIRFDDQLINGPVEFKNLFLSIPIGKEVEIEVIRDRKPIKMILKLKERPVT